MQNDATTNLLHRICLFEPALLEKEGKGFSAYPDPGMDSPSYMQNTDSLFQQESLQILSASEVGASSFFTSSALASTADMGCALSIKSAPIFQFSFVCKT